MAGNTTVIKGYSKITFTGNSSNAVKEATIKEYRIICGNNVIRNTENNNFIINNAASNTIVNYVEDSRGNVISKESVIPNFIDYFTPAILELTVSREKGGIDSNAVVVCKGQFFNGNFGNVDNELAIQYFYKIQGSGTWIQGNTEITYSASNNNFIIEAEIAGDLGANGFSIENNFDIKIIISDKITAGIFKETILQSGIPQMSIHQNGVAFGAFYDPDIGGALQVEGKRIPPLKQLYMVAGSKVVTVPAGNDSALLHTWTEIVNLFKNEYGITITERTKLAITLSNGDSRASDVHVEGSTWLGDSSKNSGDVHAVFDRVFSGDMRINYGYFYVA